MTAQQHWNALTDEDRDRAFAAMPDMFDGFMKLWGWLHFAKAIEDICREKNAPSAEARDAARYRWLLATLGHQLHGKPSLDAAWDDDIDDWRSAGFFRLSNADSINAAIDAAMGTPQQAEHGSKP